MNKKSFYLECNCYSLDHIIRFSYFDSDIPKDKELVMEARLYPFSGTTEEWLKVNKKRSVLFFDNLVYLFGKFKLWIRYVWYAIKGRPTWNQIDSIWLSNDAESIKALSIWLREVADQMKDTKQ